ANFPVVAAFWSLEFDEPEWKFVLATPHAWRDDPSPYLVVRRLLERDNVRPSRDSLAAIYPDDPLPLALRVGAATDGKPVIGSRSIWHESVGNKFIRGAYIYRAERLVPVSGTRDVLAVVRDKQARAWKCYPGVLTFKDGQLTDVKVEGHDWP